MHFRKWVVLSIAILVAVLTVTGAAVSSVYGRTLQDQLNATHSGGTFTFSPGTYIIDRPLVVPAGVTVNGNGAVLQTRANSTTPDSNDEIMLVNSGDVIRNLAFDGNQGNQGGVWTEHRHAISVLNAKNVIITADTFRNVIGDGIYLSAVSGVAVKDNLFYGDHENRNGVSVISGSDVTISGNTFDSMSRPDEPGAVDLEPNNSGQALDNITVIGNTINDPAKYGLVLWDTTGAETSGVTFGDNTINGGDGQVSGGAAIIVNSATADVTGNAINNVPQFNGVEWDFAPGGNVTGNTVNGAYVGVNRWYSPGVTVSGNTYSGIGYENEYTYP